MLILGFAIWGGLGLFAASKFELLDELHGGNRLVDIVVQCVDDEGNVITNATYDYVLFPDFNMNHMQESKGKITKNGNFRIKGKTNGEIIFTIKGNKYYNTSCDFNLFDDANSSIKDGKWQPYGVTNTVVLKRVKKPVELRRNRISSASPGEIGIIPALGKALPFDLFVGDWMPPYGKGQKADVTLEGIHVPATTGHPSWEHALTLRFCNPHDGFYRIPMDVTSQLKSPYTADTNGTFCSAVTFGIRDKTVVKDPMLYQDWVEKREMLILRLRTRVDAEGHVIGAHYAEILGPLEFIQYQVNPVVKFTCYLNTTENDPNLESDDAAERNGFDSSRGVPPWPWVPNE